MNYKIKLPLELEQFSNEDKYNYTSCSVMEFNYQGNNFLLHGEENNYFIEISNIEADSREICVSLVEKYLSDILKISSLIIQNQYSNQPLTHLRLTYSISKIQFLDEKPIDNKINSTDKHIVIDTISLHHNISMKNYDKISFEEYDKLFQCLDDKNFKYVLDSYYRALEPTDFITKYFNAFSAIEFLETNYVNKIETHKLIEESFIEKMIQSISNDLKKDDLERIKDRIKNVLSNATEENRASKLCSIIYWFGITEIHSGLLSQKIDSEFTKKIINLRNSLFHGKRIDETMDNNLKEYTPLIVLLLQYVLCNWTIDKHII